MLFSEVLRQRSMLLPTTLRKAAANYYCCSTATTSSSWLFSLSLCTIHRGLSSTSALSYHSQHQRAATTLAAVAAAAAANSNLRRPMLMLEQRRTLSCCCHGALGSQWGHKLLLHPNSFFTERVGPSSAAALRLAYLSQSVYPGEHNKRRKLLNGSVSRIRLTMTPEEREHKRNRIEQMRKEQTPPGLFAKFKYYFRRYGYIFIPVHTGVCALWFGGIYVAVRSGVDVVHMLEYIPLPEKLMTHLHNTSPTASALVLATIIYKVITPLRYASSLLAFKLVFNRLRSMGMLRTAHEVEYKVRTRVEDAWLRRRLGGKAGGERAAVAAKKKGGGSEKANGVK